MAQEEGGVTVGVVDEEIRNTVNRYRSRRKPTIWTVDRGKGVYCNFCGQIGELLLPGTALDLARRHEETVHPQPKRLAPGAILRG